jgi:sirohydrochlorin ferrochelatase
VDLLACGIAAAGPADAVVLAAAGSTDPHARGEVSAVAQALGAHVGYAATSTPRVADVVQALRRDGCGRVVVAAYLLAEGLFFRSLHRAGADAITPPLATYPELAGLVLDRYDGACRAVRQGTVSRCAAGTRA